MLQPAFCIQTQQVTARGAQELESADRSLGENLQVRALRDHGDVKELGDIVNVEQAPGRESRREALRRGSSHSYRIKNLVGGEE